MRKNLLISIMAAVILKDLPIFIPGYTLGKMIALTVITLIVLAYVDIFFEWIVRIRSTRKTIKSIKNMKLVIH